MTASYGDWLDDLDVTPDGEPEPIDLDAGEIDALKRVDYHLRHIRAIDQAKTLAAERFQAEFRRIKDLWEERSAQLDRDRAWHEAPCVALHAAILERDPSRKTIKNGLSHGVLKSITPTKPGIEWVDTPAFIEWAEDNADDLVRYKVEPDVNECKRILAAVDDKFVTPAGELVPGIIPVPPTTKFSVTPA